MPRPGIAFVDVRPPKASRPLDKDARRGCSWPRPVTAVLHSVRSILPAARGRSMTKSFRTNEIADGTEGPAGLRRLCDRLPAMAALLDANGVVLHANAAFAAARRPPHP